MSLATLPASIPLAPSAAMIDRLNPIHLAPQTAPQITPRIAPEPELAVAPAPDPAPDPNRIDDIEAAIRFLHPDGDTFEILATDYYDNPKFKHTLHGFFRDPKIAASRIANHTSMRMRAKAIYVSANPITRDLYETCANKLEQAGTGSCAGEQHTTHIKFFRVDVDPDRTSGISQICSTQAELDAVREVANGVVDFLASHGFGHPHRVETGNGNQLIYPADLPNTPENVALVKQFLKALDHKVSKPGVAKIDTGAFVLPMRVRVAGTHNRKGDDSPERPNRQVFYQLAGKDKPATIVAKECLEAVAAMAPVEAPKSRPTTPFSSGSQSPAAWAANGDVKHTLRTEAWLSHYGIDFRLDNRGGDYEIYHLPRCLLDESHDERGKVSIRHNPSTYEVPQYHCWKCCKNDKGISFKNFSNLIGPPLADHFDPPKYPKKRGRPRKLRLAVNTTARANNSASASTSDAVTEGSQPGSELDISQLGLPEVEVGFDEFRVNNEAITALATDDSIYQRDRSLVQIYRDLVPTTHKGITRAPNAPRIVSMEEPTIREHLTKAARFVKRVSHEDGGTELVQTSLPNSCVKAVAARGYWSGMRPLEGITCSPILRPDGSILRVGGYDAETGILYESGSIEINVPDNPTQDDAKAAAAELLEVVEDFPFQKPSHKSAWLAFVLTPIARHLIRGACPLTFCEASDAGSGKGLCMDCGAIISTGSKASKMTPPKDDDEMRKKITTVSLSGDQIVLIDNVEGDFGYPSLDAALTATKLVDRQFCTFNKIESSLTAVWAATGNNPCFIGDSPRRICSIRLVPRSEIPEERTGFKHPNLEQWVESERPRLLSAALTILSAFCRAGRPAPETALKPLGSYEAWSDLIRHAIVWVGQPDPCEDRRELLKKSAKKTNAKFAIFHNWSAIDPGNKGVTAAQILRTLRELNEPENPEKAEGQESEINKSGPNEQLEAFRGAIQELCPGHRGTLPSAVSLGKAFERLREQTVGDKQLDSWISRGTTFWSIS